MPRPLSKKSKTRKAIKLYVRLGYSANIIQKRLASRGLGVRRKRLLEEIRLIKHKKLELSERQKHIPKKYRITLIPVKKPRIESIYRISLIISDVPVHSRPFRRNYLGFRLQAFSFSIDKLHSVSSYLEKLLVNLTSEFLGYRITEWENFDFYIGKERPVMIHTSNARMINGRWIFRVEKEGRELYEKSGYI